MSPQSILPLDFGLHNLDTNKSIAKKLLAKSNTKKFNTVFKSGSELYRSGYKLFLIKDGIIYYYVQYEIKKIRALNCSAAVQVKVWRGFSNSDSINFPTFVFYNHIIGQTGVVVTDMLQSSDGRRFWEDRAAQAFDLGYFVYYVDMLDPVKIVELTSATDLINISDEAWGNSNKYKARRVVISKRKLI